MATKRPSFQKMERDRNKRAKQALKRERRQARADGEDEGDGEGAEGAAEQKAAVDEAAVLAKLDTLHKRFEDEEIDFDTFEEERAELLGLLTQD